MKFEDVKVGMRVVYNKGKEDQDIGTVTSIEGDGIVYAKWDSDSLVLSVHHGSIEPLETEQAVEIGFKINPAQKIKKVVEVEEETPETFTFTLSRRAAHELRAILGIMGCCQLCSELKEFFVHMSNQEDMLHLLETRSVLQADFRQENIYK